MVVIKQLIWDEVNLAHMSQKHGVSREEVEQACETNPVLLKGHSGRILAVGYTANNRVLSIVLDPKGGNAYYPVTARPASRKERAYYQQVKGSKAA